jgi:cation diffusion facilitator CzcD-associated flavoprotein CzcO
MRDGHSTRARVVIVGAGFGGVGLGIKLKKSGLDDFIILEKSDSVGGVWHDNRYPGAACDVPSRLYSFSFEPWFDWPDRFASQSDILDYLRNCARKYDLESHIRFGAQVIEARWDDSSKRWFVQTSNGDIFSAQSLVSATGQLSRPFVPKLPGIESFVGAAFHSARWRPEYDLADKRIGVIGTGASSIQIIPAIAPLVRTLYVFQRTAAYVLPKRNKAYSRQQRSTFRRFPILPSIARFLKYAAWESKAFAFVTWRTALRVKRSAFFRNLGRGVQNPDLRSRLTPDYRIGCKRILLSDEFYPAMSRPNVELVTEGIVEVRTDAIVTADGTEHKVDCIIFATGFAATEFLVPMKVTGLRGQDLHEAWKGGAEAHLGITVAGFPNFFMLYGPNTNLAHNSIVYMIESQIRFIMACIVRLCRDEVRSIEVRQDIQDRFNRKLQRRLQKATWSKGCTSWYLTAAGKNVANWPGYSLEFRLRTHTPTWDEYAVH